MTSYVELPIASAFLQNSECHPEVRSGAAKAAELHKEASASPTAGLPFVTELREAIIIELIHLHDLRGTRLLAFRRPGRKILRALWNASQDV